MSKAQRDIIVDRGSRRNIKFGRKARGKGNTTPADRRAFWYVWAQSAHDAGALRPQRR